MIKALIEKFKNKNSPNKLIYLFPPTTIPHLGMGTELFHNNSEFKSIIIESNQYILKAGGNDILWLFENKCDLKEIEDDFYYIYILAVEIALYHLFKKNIPNDILFNCCCAFLVAI